MIQHRGHNQMSSFVCVSGLLCLSALGLFVPLPGGMRASSTESAHRSYTLQQYGRLPISFEPNRRQFDSRFQFLARSANTALLLRPDAAVLKMSRGAEKRSIEMRILGANAGAVMRGVDKLPGEANYFSGERQDWITHVPTYERVYVDEVYPGIDLTYYGNPGHLEYDFIVKPGATPAGIDVNVEGAAMRLADGDLVLSLGDREIRQRKPTVYQDVDGRRRMIAARYLVRDGGRFGFEVGAYDPTRPLIIDPQLIYSAYMFLDQGLGVAIDASGNAYVCGATMDLVLESQTDAFVVKINSSGTAVVYGNTFGSRGRSDQANATTVDAAGNAYVAGYTAGWAPAGSFPTLNPIQSVQSTTHDVAFITKFDSSGAMAYSTVLGGSGIDSAGGIAVDAQGDMYVSGYTSSTDFPTSQPLQATLKGSSDAFVTALNAQGNAFIFSTYVGGSGDDYASGIAVDNAGNSYVSGTTSSNDFPTANAINPAGSGAFAFKLNPAGSAFQYSTYLGETRANGIAIDSPGNAYVVGTTGSPSNAFVKKINSSGSAFAYSTQIGGTSDDVGNGIAVDESGKAFVTGNTASNDFPQIGSLETLVAGSTDAFLAKLSTTGNIAYSTLLAGNSNSPHRGTNAFNSGQSVASDAAGNVYVSGWTTAWNFPTTSGSVSRTWIANSNWDKAAFVVKLTDDAASATITQVQSRSAEGTGLGSLSVSFPSANTPGNLIIAFVRMSTTTQTVTVRDTAGNAYVDAVAQAQTADGHQIHLFYAKHIAGGSNTVTAAFSSTNNHPWLAIYEYSGVSTTNPLDQVARAQGSSNSPFSGLITTTANNELEFAATGLPASYTGSVTPGGGILQLQDTGTSRAATETDVLTRTSNDYAGRFFLSSSTNWTIAVATFVAAGPLRITTQTLPDGRVNGPYSAQLTAADGTAPYSWSADRIYLPDGLTLNSSTGILSGTPTQMGQYTFTVAVTDAAVHTSYRVMNLFVPDPTPATVQMNSVEGTAVGSVSVPFGSNNTRGNLIVAFVRMSTTWQTVTLTDSAGNTYFDAAAQFQATDGHQIHVFYAKNIAGGPNTVRATFSSTNNHPWLAIFEVRGLSTSNPLDQTAHAQGFSSSVNSGSISTSSNELLVEATGLPASFTGTVSGFAVTLQDTGTSRAATGIAFTLGPGQPSAQFNLSSPTNWTAVIVSFKP